MSRPPILWTPDTIAHLLALRSMFGPAGDLDPTALRAAGLPIRPEMAAAVRPSLEGAVRRVEGAIARVRAAYESTNAADWTEALAELGTAANNLECCADDAETSIEIDAWVERGVLSAAPPPKAQGR